MAVKLEGTIRRYIGLSSDHKPYTFPLDTGEEKPPDGSTFLEGDTGVVFRWSQDTWWPQTPEGRAQEIQAIGNQEAIGHLIAPTRKDEIEALFR